MGPKVKKGPESAHAPTSINLMLSRHQLQNLIVRPSNIAAPVLLPRMLATCTLGKALYFAPSPTATLGDG
jgi:hypothetical protein